MESNGNSCLLVVLSPEECCIVLRIYHQSVLQLMRIFTVVVGLTLVMKAILGLMQVEWIRRRLRFAPTSNNDEYPRVVPPHRGNIDQSKNA
jgi:hypothetical protein